MDTIYILEDYFINLVERFQRLRYLESKIFLTIISIYIVTGNKRE